MKTQIPSPMPFLTERERQIAERVRKMRDLQVLHRDVVGGGAQKFGGTKATLAEVENSGQTGLTS